MSKLNHFVELGLIAQSNPYGMVDILLSVFIVHSSYLQMPVFNRTYPHISPCRRYYKFFYAFELFFICYFLFFESITKSSARFFSYYSIFRICYVNQVYCFCRFLWIVANFCNLFRTNFWKEYICCWCCHVISLLLINSIYNKPYEIRVHCNFNN